MRSRVPSLCFRIGFLAFFLSSMARAGVEQLGLSYQYSVPLAYQYLNFKPSFSVFANATGESGLFNQERLHLHSQVGVHRYSLRNIPAIHYQNASFGVGVMIRETPVPKLKGNSNGKKPVTAASGEARSPLQLNMSFLVGGAFEWLSLPNSNAQFVNGFGGFFQASPAIEYWMAERYGVALSSPVQVFIFKATQVIWNAEFGLRFKL